MKKLSVVTGWRGVSDSLGPRSVSEINAALLTGHGLNLSICKICSL